MMAVTKGTINAQRYGYGQRHLVVAVLIHEIAEMRQLNTILR